MAEQVAFLDFETAAIQPRPHYPPAPAGVALRLPGERKSRYLAWGHPTENNCTREQAREELTNLWQSGVSVSMHNAKFDLDVAETHLGLSLLPAERVHDTMVMAFLVDPHAKKIGLKELADQRLGLPPVERDAVREWLIDHGVVNRANKKGWGAHIATAPGDLVESYACGDTDRTRLLHQDLFKEVKSAGMLEAYDRERRLIRVLLQNEREGVWVDLEQLEHDVALYTKALADVDQQLFRWLGQELNLDSDVELADALDKKLPGIDWPLTEKGARSTSKDSLEQVLSGLPDQRVLALFVYRATVMTCVRTFMEPWLNVARQTGGKIHTQWNSVAQPEGGGTRTGRLSSSPNFQNIPTLESPKFTAAIALWERYLKRLPPLPAVRSYIIADDEDHVLLDRDFDGQELRVLAHFEDGGMVAAYREDPHLDLHQMARDLIEEQLGMALTRKQTKILAFSILYGAGLGTLAERLGVTVDEARRFKNAYLGAFPGIKDLDKDLKRRAGNNIPMQTWGGRRYYAEPPRVVGDKLRDFGYKLLNFLIQGSSADITKEAVLRYDSLRRDSRLVLTVHDQIIISCPEKAAKQEMGFLRQAMESVELDVPMLSDGKVGYRWTEMSDFN